MELLFLDTETGGVNPFKNSLLQVGMVTYIDGEIKNTEEFSIKEDIYQVTAYSLEFNGLDLYKDIYKIGISKTDAVQKIIDFTKNNFTDKPILVGHNPSIDKYMIKELFFTQKLEMDDYISYRMIDTMSLIWGLYLAGKLPKEACSSEGAFKYFNIENQNKHRALDDAIATLHLFENLIELLK